MAEYSICSFESNFLPNRNLIVLITNVEKTSGVLNFQIWGRRKCVKFQKNDGFALSLAIEINFKQMSSQFKSNPFA